MSINVKCRASQFSNFVNVLKNRKYLMYEFAQGAQGEMIINLHWHKKDQDGVLTVIKNVIICTQDAEIETAWEVTPNIGVLNAKMQNGRLSNKIIRTALLLEDALNS